MELATGAGVDCCCCATAVCCTVSADASCSEIDVAFATPWKGIRQPLMMEAHSLQHALKWCEEKSLVIHQIETDCKILVNAITKGYSNNIHLQEFINNINSLLSSFPKSSFS
ncbi:hypothetical protein F8388_003218 [Cannabis sativa]|uniref:RNase H type-1 domain-containing protein n=1 Tax=Cannabis sativa TaxID=3483 RepID=A0A7J6FLU2_CANSA|nr:hypothetical protein F8388_003218 [Cannabis sativa]